MMPYEYTYCVDQNSKLISMQMSFTDPNDPDFKPIILPLAGPKEPEKKEEEKQDEQKEGNEDEENSEKADKISNETQDEPEVQ